MAQTVKAIKKKVKDLKTFKVVDLFCTVETNSDGRCLCDAASSASVGSFTAKVSKLRINHVYYFVLQLNVCDIMFRQLLK